MEIDVLIEGFYAARARMWPGQNPYPDEPRRSRWLEGFKCHRPANDRGADGPASGNDNPLPDAVAL